MSILKWGWLLVLPVFLVGCGTTPLEGDLDEVPADFFFRYVTENAIDVSAGAPGEETGEPAPGEETGEPAPGEETGEPEPGGATPVDPPPETTAPSARGPVPSHLDVSVNVDGVVHYEAAYLSPRPARKSGEAKLDRDGLLRIVNALRAAKPFQLQNVYEGDNTALGRTTYEIIAMNKQKRIVVEGTRLPEMEAVRKVILEEVTGEKILEYPEQGKKLIIMDIRTNEFHRYDSPRVQEIPIEFRRQYTSYTKALDADGWPAPEYSLGANRPR